MILLIKGRPLGSEGVKKNINLSTCSHVLNYEVKSNKLIDKQAHQHHYSFYNIIAQ